MKETKFKKRTLKKEVAIVVAAFGSATKGRLAYERFNAELVSRTIGQRIAWAYTSEIVREKTGHPGILEALASLETEGYRKIAVQPLHVFPATEYNVLDSTCRSFPGIRVFMGETLMHRWKFVDQVFSAVARDFLPEEEGINVVVGHGTPLCADPANTIYLNLKHYLESIYPNVVFTTIDGVPSMDMAMPKIKRFREAPTPLPKARIIPFMYVAGVHVEDDLLAKEDSLAAELVAMGFEVDCPTTKYQDQIIPKTLGFYPEVIDQFINRIERSLELTHYF